MKIIITGDISTRDKFKLTGFINSFSNNMQQVIASALSKFKKLNLENKNKKIK